MLGGPLHPIPSKGLYYFLVASFFFFFKNRFEHQPLGEARGGYYFTVYRWGNGGSECVSHLF